MWPRLFRTPNVIRRGEPVGISPGSVRVGTEKAEDLTAILRPMLGRRVWFRPLATDASDAAASAAEEPAQEGADGLYLADRDIKGSLLAVVADEIRLAFPVQAAPTLAELPEGHVVLVRIPTDGGVFEAPCQVRELGGEEGEYFLRLSAPPEIFRLQRRSFVRVPCQLDAELYQEGWPSRRRARVINLSAGGVGLVASLRPEVGDRFMLHIRGRSRGLEEAGLGDAGLGPLKVEVRRISQNLRGLLEVGAIWVDPADEHQEALARLLKVLEQMRAKESGEKESAQGVESR